MNQARPDQSASDIDLLPNHDEQALVDISKADFEHLLRTKDRHTTLKVDDMRELCTFLQSDANELDARNTEALLSYVHARQLSVAAFEYLIDVICDKVSLGTISASETASVLNRLTTTPIARTKAAKKDEIMLRACERCWSNVLESAHGRTQKLHSDIVGSLLRSMATLPIDADSQRLVFTTLDDLAANADDINDTVLAQGFALASRSLGSKGFGYDPENQAAIEQILQALSILPAGRADAVVIATAEQLIDFAGTTVKTSEFGDAQGLTTKTTKRALMAWYRCVTERHNLIKDSFASSVWPKVHGIILEHLKPHSLAPLYRGLDTVDFSRILLQYWVPRVAFQERDTATRHTEYSVASSEEREIDDRFEQLGVVYTASGPLRPTMGPINRPTATLRHIREAFAAELSTYTTNDPHAVAPLVKLICVLQRFRVRYDDVLSKIILVLRTNKGPQTLFRFVSQLARKGIHLPAGIAVKLVNHLLKVDQPRLAYIVFANVGSVWLSHCHALPLALIENSALPGRRLWRMLNRSPGTRVPLSLRTSPTLSLSEAHVSLVHLIAHTFAKSELYPPRVSFRRVYECYRYLLDRGAPLSNLISRALVIAGVIRPLQQGLWVSTIKFRFILKVVTSVEGPEIAHAIDILAYRWRCKVALRKDTARRLWEFGQQAEDMASQVQQRTLWNNCAWSKASSRSAGRSKLGQPSASIERQEQPSSFGAKADSTDLLEPLDGAESHDVDPTSPCKVDSLSSRGEGDASQHGASKQKATQRKPGSRRSK